MTKPTDYDFLLEFNDSSGNVCLDSSVNAVHGVIGEELTVLSTSANVADAQGYSTDGTNHFTTGTAALSKWNSGYTIETQSNNSPFTSLSGSPDHVGGCQFYNTYLYAVVEQYTNCSTFGSQNLVLYNASDLSYSTHTDISANAHECSGVAINSTDNRLYISSYCDGSEIHAYNLTTHAYVRAIPMSFTVKFINGITYDSGFIYVVSNNLTSPIAGNGLIYKFEIVGSLGSETCELRSVYRVPTITHIEDIDVSSGSFRYNSAPEATIKTCSIPSAATRTVGEIDLNQQYWVHMPYQLPSEGTIIFEVTPNTFFNYNAMFDSALFSAQDWQSWIYGTGQLAVRIDATQANYTFSSATSTYKVAITWAINGTNRDVELYVDDVSRDTDIQNYVTPSEFFNIGAGNIANVESDSTFNYFAVFPRVVSAADIADFDGVGGSTLVIQDLSQSQALDNIDLTQANTLTTNDIAQAQALEPVTLAVAGTLTVSSLAQPQLLEQINLLQQNILALSDISQAQTLENIDLTQQNNLTVSDLSQSQSLENITLELGLTLSVAGISQSQSLEQVNLTQQSILTILNLVQAQNLDSVNLTQSHVLIIDDIGQGHILDSCNVFTSVVGYVTGIISIKPLVTASINIDAVVTGTLTVDRNE